jgi:glycosyltransferase involved in cell wall biosynthesis
MIDSRKNKMLLEKPVMVIAVNIVRSLTTICKGQITFYRQHGFDVDALAHNDLPNGVELVTGEGANFFEMDFVRDVSPGADLKDLKRMYRLFRRRRPTIIQLMSPKPCILGTVAGRLAGVPIIVRHVWGNLRESEFKGAKRFFLFSSERLSNMLAHEVIVISHKLKDSEVSAGALNPKKAVVFGSGSSNGLNLNRFELTPERKERGRQIRQQLLIADDWKVLGTAMRVNIEKGICELVEAYLKLSRNIPNLALMILGDYDVRGQPPEHIIRTIKEHPRIRHVGFQENIEDYYAAMDLFVMPSYREGFCESNIEASGMGLPIVATNIIGCSESVLDGVTGLLVPPRNSDALADAIKRILTNPQLAQQLGKNGRERMEREFDQKLIWHGQLRSFCYLMQKKSISPPVNPELITGTTCPMCRK